MSSGAKRPPAEVSAYAPAGASSCKPKRRKQSTPVRISGESGPDPPLPPPSPTSPAERLLQSPASHPHMPNEGYADAFGKNQINIYAEALKSQNKEQHYPDENTERHVNAKNNNHDLHNQIGAQLASGGYKHHDARDSGYFQKYREQILDEENKFNQIGLTISRVRDASGDGDKNEDENGRLNSFVMKNEQESSNVYRQRNSDDERLLEMENYELSYKKINDKRQHEETDAQDRSHSGANSENLLESPDAMERYHRSNSDGRHSCGRCGLIFPALDLLRLHYESEHSERNGRASQGIECKIEPFEAEDSSPRNSSGPTPAPMTDPRMDPWSVEFQTKMADIYKNALNFPHDIPKETLPPNFNPLCPPFPLFSSAVPPQRPLMEPIRIFNPEAYCELCSKEFCNKYFLKTHKANKHGIYENTPSSSGTEGLNLESSIMPTALATSALKFKNNMMLAEYAKSYEAAILASQRHKVKIQRMMEEARDMDKANVDCQNAGLNMSRQVHLDDVRSSSDDNTIPENFIYKGDVRHDQDEAFMTPTPRKLSPDSSKRARESGFNTDTLRRLGVINPEAFCKICCKEYCNKYFLKTHKIKRHGLLPSPTDKYNSRSQEQVITTVNMSEPQTDRKEGQTSPLNLIMSEENQDKQQQSPEVLISSKQTKGISITPTNIRPNSSQSIDSSSIDEKKENINEDLIKSENAKQSPTSVFISEDLQKLQTMISQLNDLSVNKIVECYVCKKEFENNYILQFHMMSDHGISVSGAVDSFTFANSDEINPEAIPSQKTMCTICEKDFSTISVLKKHIEEFHTQKLNFPDAKNTIECLTSEKEINLQRERRASMSLTPTNSYCEICNKELCNKYFMKTHMQRMHGIEIENGTQIGGVICDICNKELCSKYFLRVHKHNTHGIVEPGAPLPQMRNLNSENETYNAPQVASPLKPPPETSILNNRFIAHFIEVCPFCSRRFRTSKWLKAHLLSDHGKAGIDKWKELEVQYKAQAKVQSAKNNKQMGNALTIPDANSNPTSSQITPLDVNDRIPFYSKLGEPKILNLFGMNNPDMKTYNCSYCPFSTSILSFLYVHEKSHVQGTEMDILCPMCPESFNKPEALQIHIITAHSLPEWRERPGLSSSPSSNRECQSRQMKTPPLDNEDDKSLIQTSNGNGKSEFFDCYECDFKSCNFTEMESHLKTQHCAIKDGTYETNADADRENFNDDRRSKMPAIYAVPKSLDGGSERTEPTSITMQPFVIEENTSEIDGGKFVPSIVFLPVRRRTTGMITISFNLTPA